MKKFLSTLLLILCLIPCASAITVISYNIRNGEAHDGTNSWTYRAPASALMILDQKPDIFGLQEAYKYQVDFLQTYCEDYKNIGVGREDGKSEGEHMSIFYNKKTVSLIKWGTFWLSDTPDTPSLGWDGACKRTATWALMKDKATGNKFFYVNTHLDHVGVEARKNGLSLIMNKVENMNQDGLPLVITGDFNMEENHPSMSEIKAKMRNTRNVAAKTDDHFTFNGWGTAKETIDFIWFSGFDSCPEYETVTKPYQDRTFISDHFPVKASLVF